MFIDWTGDVMPCCNLRSDIDSHKSYILGNIKNSSLQNIFFSPLANKLRQHLVNFSEKRGPCRRCGYDVFYHSKKAEKLMNRVLENINSNINSR
jgi:radical SAM protein with 4Fe4S-binding SPASM domain